MISSFHQFLIVLLCSCENNEVKTNLPESNGQSSAANLDELFGVWGLDNNTMYSFDGLGNGTLILSNEKYSFSYEINADNLSIDFEKEVAKDSTYKFEIRDNTLILTSQDNNKGSYKLTKE